MEGICNNVYNNNNRRRITIKNTEEQKTNGQTKTNLADPKQVGRGGDN